MFALSIAVAVALESKQSSHPPTLAPLVEALRDADVETRHYAGAAIAQLGPVAIERLRFALVDPDRQMRAGAAYALGQFGVDAAPAKADLIHALKDEDRDVRRQAAYAVSRLLSAERESLGLNPNAPPPVMPPDPPPK